MTNLRDQIAQAVGTALSWDNLQTDANGGHVADAILALLTPAEEPSDAELGLTYYAAAQPLGYIKDPAAGFRAIHDAGFAAGRAEGAELQKSLTIAQTIQTAFPATDRPRDKGFV